MKALGIVLLVGGLVVPAAQAQDDAGTERARELFAEGVAHSERGEYAEAVVSFQEAYARVQAPNIAYNLAVAHAELGQLVEASEYVRAVLEDEEAPRDVRRLAARLGETIGSRLAHLTVQLSQSRGTVAIVLDGTALLDDQLGTPFPVNPGDHVISAERNGQVLERLERTLGDGEEAIISLDPSSWPGASLDPELYDDAPRTEEVAEPAGPIYTTWWFWTAVGVVVIGTAVIIGVTASGTEGPLDGNTNPAVVRF
jgi:tetratricopeptide (TPR) repeat protein